MTELQPAVTVRVPALANPARVALLKERIRIARAKLGVPR